MGFSASAHTGAFLFSKKGVASVYTAEFPVTRLSRNWMSEKVVNKLAVNEGFLQAGAQYGNVHRNFTRSITLNRPLLCLDKRRETCYNPLA